MAGQPYEPFTTADSFSHYPTSSSSYSYLDSQYGANLTSMEPYPQGSTSYDFSLDATSNLKYESPAATEAEHFMPRLTASSESGQSTSSSAMGSPQLHAIFPHQEPWNPLLPSSHLGMHPDMSSSEIFAREPFYTASLEQESVIAAKMPGFVDPSSLAPFGSPMPFNYADPSSAMSPRLFEHPPSPALSASSSRSRPGKASRPSPHQSPYLSTQQYHPYPQGRRLSTTSLHSHHSQNSHRSGSFELSEEDKEKGVCPIPDCGRAFKDLKAHMLTHQTERPEKCPISTCEYHIKGFARKYDKNRHTLTHYKGTMVCGFCPGSGTSIEKSFNRADVFKRHLTTVHGVEQTAPNSRRKSPISANKKNGSTTGSGTCSTCDVTFPNAQEFYEHLDDCVLRVVQQIDPAEDINQKNLSSIAEDAQVIETLENHGLPSSADYSLPSNYDEEDDMEEEDADADDDRDASYGSRAARSGKGTIKSGRKDKS